MPKQKRTYTKQQIAIIRRKKMEIGKLSANSTQSKSSHVYINEYPHFRNYKKSKHPALILELTKHNKTDEAVYAYRDVTHSKVKSYDEIVPNPDPSDSKPMRINSRVRFDVPENFSDKPLPWKYPKK